MKRVTWRKSEVMKNGIEINSAFFDAGVARRIDGQPQFDGLDNISLDYGFEGILKIEGYKAVVAGEKIKISKCGSKEYKYPNCVEVKDNVEIIVHSKYKKRIGPL